MNPNEYAAQQAAISAAVARYVVQFGKLFTKPALKVSDWLGFLQFLFPTVEAQRQASATLARAFYDSQRSAAHPDLPMNKVSLEGYSFERFTQDMAPAREQMSKPDSNENAIGQVAAHATRAVENAGRQQIIHAVQNDPEEHIIRGWARVATGRETCAWCLMLVSRGPVYLGADTAGLNLSDDTAQRMIAAGTDVSEFMQQWHPNCDCKVVPVFKQVSWAGQAAQKRALELWNEATKEAIAQEDNPGVHATGKNKGKEFTRNQLAINALRRRLAQGDISPSEWAATAAA